MIRRKLRSRNAAVGAAMLALGCGAVRQRQPTDDGSAMTTRDAQADAVTESAADSRADADAASDRGVSSDAPADAPADSACQPEQCNGRDDDCDGVIDDGCPIDQRPLLTRTVAEQSPIFGALGELGNTAFTDACPDGQVVIGLTGNAGAALDAVGVNCGTLQVREDRSTTPYRYAVAVGPGMQYAPLGGTGGGQHALDNALLCAVDEVVTSVQLWREPPGTCASNGCAASATSAVGCPTLYAVAVSCAKLAIKGAPGAFTLELGGTPVPSARVGGAGRSGVPPTQETFSCPPAGVVRSANGAFGPWPSSCAVTVVNGLQMTCTNPVLPLR